MWKAEGQKAIEVEQESIVIHLNITRHSCLLFSMVRVIRGCMHSGGADGISADSADGCTHGNSGVIGEFG